MNGLKAQFNDGRKKSCDIAPMAPGMSGAADTSNNKIWKCKRIFRYVFDILLLDFNVTYEICFTVRS